MKSLLLGAFCLGLSAAFQYKVMFPALMDMFQQGPYASLLREQSAIPFGSYLYHNMLGGYLAFVLPLGLYFALHRRNILFSILSAVLIAGLALSSTRIGMLLVMTFLAVIVVLLMRSRDGKGLLVTGVVLALAVALIGALIYTPSSSPDVNIGQVLEEKMKTLPTQVSTLNTRTDIWKNGLAAFVRKPVIGYGAGCFEHAYRQWCDGGTYTAVAHSTLMKVGVELGILGLLAFLLYLTGVAARLKKALHDPFHLFSAIAAASGLAFSLVDFSFDVDSHVVTFFALTAVFFAPGPVCGKGSKCSPSMARGPLGYVVFTLLMAALISSEVFTMKANLFRKSIETGVALEEMGLDVNAERVYGEAITTMPLSSEGLIRITENLSRRIDRVPTKGEGENLRRKMEGHIQEMERFRDEDSELFFALGRAYFALGDAEKASLCFLKARSLYPTSAYYIFETARFLYIVGNRQGSLDLVRSFEPLVEKYRTPHNPRGIHVYKIRDLEAFIEYRNGNIGRALKIARTNYHDALSDSFVTTSVRSRERAPKEAVVRYLGEKVRFYEEALRRPPIGSGGP